MADLEKALRVTVVTTGAAPGPLGALPERDSGSGVGGLTTRAAPGPIAPAGISAAQAGPLAELAAGDPNRFARIIRMTGDVLNVEAVGIEVLDHQKRWSTSGLVSAPFDSSVVHDLCSATMALGDVHVVDGAAGAPGSHDEPGASIRFFAACPLASTLGGITGVLWVASAHPRLFTDADRERLRDLAQWVVDESLDAGELTRSRRVQQALLPKSFATLDGYDVAGSSAPKQAVGGDFYDWYPVQDGAAFTLGDVMGKGMPAALIATTVRAVMRAGSRWGGVAAAAEAAEDTLDADLSGASMFVTLFHAYLDEETGMVRYIDAGHGLSLVVHEDGTNERLFSNAVPLGAGGNADWRTETVRLVAGSTLVSFSDGLLDVFDGTLGAMDQVESIVRSASSAQSVVDALLGLVDPSVTDDVTVVCIKRTSAESDWD